MVGRLEISEDGLTAGLDRMIAAVTDWTPAMTAIAGLMESHTRLRFETGEGPDGQAWTPSQRVLAEGGRTLVDTGALLSSIAAMSDSTSAAVGTNLVYAAVHQKGGRLRPRAGSGKRALKTPFGPRAAVNMPARPFLGFGRAEREDIPKILADHVLAAARGRR
ncbi:MAG: phage virion morphogenesis protein [Sphingomonadaceae bacterium]